MRNNQILKGTEIRSIPREWKVVRLGEKANVRYGLGQPPALETNGIPMIRATNVKRGKIAMEGLIFINPNAVPNSRDPFLRAGDILVVRSGAYTGDVGLVTKEWEGAVAGYDLIVTPSDTIDSRFLTYYLLSSSVQKRHFVGLKVRSAQPHLNSSQLEETPIPLPPLPEQKKIAEVLSTVDQAIEKIDEAIEKNQKLKKGLMQELLTEGIGHKEFKDSEIGRIPKEWDIRKLGEVITLCQYGLSIAMSQEGEYPIVKMDDIVNGYVVADKVKYVNLDKRDFENFKLKKGDILFNRTNSYELVGRTGVFTLDGNYVFASYLIRIRPDTEVLNSFFLTLYLIFSGEKLRQLATRAVHQANINATTLQKVVIPIPHLPEQQKIAEILSAADERLGLLRTRKERLGKIKKGLMNNLLTGKWRVNI